MVKVGRSSPWYSPTVIHSKWPCRSPNAKRDSHSHTGCDYGSYIQYESDTPSTLCRVFSTNAVFNVIKDELTDRCNVIPPPVSTLQKSVVDESVDPSYCTIRRNRTERQSDGSDAYKEEKEVFFMAMELFCDLESGHALIEGYGWPDLETTSGPQKFIDGVDLRLSCISVDRLISNQLNKYCI
ncbi:hypothetical protein ACHAWO_002321 [Cyclotella atomus]|uniref:Uncharacterized protein n=1 Tax=Cyclotella atomus TaxID=382360 RepID=A0ABD3Q301_9STRA